MLFFKDGKPRIFATNMLFQLKTTINIILVIRFIYLLSNWLEDEQARVRLQHNSDCIGVSRLAKIAV